MLTPTTCPPAVARSSLTGTADAVCALIRGTTDFWTGAVSRGLMPWEVSAELGSWWEAVADREPPEWSSPNELVWQSDLMALRDFSQGAKEAVVPTLVLPPQAGHHSSIVDYSPRQSQMQVIRAAGLTRAFALEWLGARPGSPAARAGIEDYIDQIARAIDDIGGPVNLIGDCQGGWLAAIYAALRPADVHTLTIAGAPIDFHAGDPVIGGYVELLDSSFYGALVDSGGGVLSGKYLLGGFIAIKPGDEVGRHLELLNHIGEPEHVERYRDFEDWFKWTQDLSGEFYLWIVEHLFRRNALIRGELEIGGKLADLGNIECPLFMLAGSTDHITPPAQVFAAADHVSTPRADTLQRVATGGHLGLFMGRESLRDHWPPVLAEVFARSKTGSPSKSAARRRATATTPKGTPPELPAP